MKRPLRGTLTGLHPKTPCKDWLVRLQLLTLLLLLAVSGGAQAESALRRVGSTPWSGFDHYTVPRADGSFIDLYVAQAQGAAPTVVLFGGSKALPAVMLKGERLASTLMFFEHLSARDGVNIVVVEKRGLTPFLAAPQSREQAQEWERAAFESGLYRKETRVEDGVAVVTALRSDERFANLHWLGILREPMW